MPLSPENRKLLWQTLILWALTMLAIRILHQLQGFPIVRNNLMLFTGLFLIYVPMMALWRRRERIVFFEGTWEQLLGSVGWFLILSVVLFPLLEIGNRYFQDWVFHRHYVGGNYKGIGEVILFQLVLIAFPEEFFFRGYMQVQLDRVFGKPFRLLGAQVGWSLLLTSLIFAFSHSLIQRQWWHFSIFFPALAFGWLREKTGAITASVLFHALSNVYSYWVGLNYRP